MHMYCRYYRAHITKKECTFFVAVFRSFDHIAFDRTYDKQESEFEFFVPQEMEKKFLKIMEFFINKGIVTQMRQLPNRLLDATQTV